MKEILVEFASGAGQFAQGRDGAAAIHEVRGDVARIGDDGGGLIEQTLIFVKGNGRGREQIRRTIRHGVERPFEPGIERPHEKPIRVRKGARP